MYTIAIVGRPNVGKSTLFNMLIGKRLAITHEQAGVTRDVKKVRKVYEGIEFDFFDTGGITDEGVFSDKISELSYSVFDKVDLVLLVLSAEESTAEDEDIIHYIRQNNISVMLVVNKADNESREWQSAEYYRYGMGDPIMVSALHKRNFDILWKKIFERLKILEEIQEMQIKSESEDEFVELEDCEIEIDGFEVQEIEVPERIKLLIMGKPNTGKSSLLNAFLGKERAMVSNIPGTTRDLVEEEVEIFGQKFSLIDSAGIRRKNKIYDDIEYYSSHRAISAIVECHVVLLMIDVMEGMSEQDKKLASMILRQGKGMVIGLNKWDLIEIKENRLNAEKDRLSYLVPQIQYVPVCPLSAKNNKGLSTIVSEVQKVHSQLFIKINTSLLNRDIQKWVDNNPPPYAGRRRGKLKFVAQSSINPIVFQARVNNPDFFSDSYKQYLVNKIRDKYNIKNVPLRLDLILNR